MLRIGRRQGFMVACEWVQPTPPLRKNRPVAAQLKSPLIRRFLFIPNLKWNLFASEALHVGLFLYIYMSLAKQT